MTGFKARVAAHRPGYGWRKCKQLSTESLKAAEALLAGGARCEDVGAATDGSRSGGYGGTLRGAAVCAGRSGHDEIAIFGITRADERCARVDYQMSPLDRISSCVGAVVAVHESQMRWLVDKMLPVVLCSFAFLSMEPPSLAGR